MAGSIPVRGFGVPAPKQVPEGAWRGDLSISGVEDHADVFGNNGRLDAVVQLCWRHREHVRRFDIHMNAEMKPQNKH